MTYNYREDPNARVPALERLIERQGDEIARLIKDYETVEAHCAAMQAALASVLPEMRREHDAGDGHFSTAQIAAGEAAITAHGRWHYQTEMTESERLLNDAISAMGERP